MTQTQRSRPVPADIRRKLILRQPPTAATARPARPALAVPPPPLPPVRPGFVAPRPAPRAPDGGSPRAVPWVGLVDMTYSGSRVIDVRDVVAYPETPDLLVTADGSPITALRFVDNTGQPVSVGVEGLPGPPGKPGDPGPPGKPGEVPEAPLDGQQYARKSAAWAVVAPSGTGTVTSTSVISANGLAGTVATATTTPAITLSTTVTGMLKGNGTAIGAALAGTDYVAPSALTGYLPLAGGQLAAPAVLGWTGKSQISSPADGNFLVTNNAGSGLGMLQLGGTTNAFPAFFRSGNAISVVLADGSNYATLNANNFNVQNGLFYQTFGSISSPGIDGQFEFFNNAGTAATRLDIATDGDDQVQEPHQLGCHVTHADDAGGAERQYIGDHGLREGSDCSR